VSPAFLDFFFFSILPSAVVNLSLDTWHVSPSYSPGPVLRSCAPSLLVYWVLMVAVWTEVEDSHAFLLAVVYRPYGQMRMMVV
jgi:hypothetical protein